MLIGRLLYEADCRNQYVAGYREAMEFAENLARNDDELFIRP